MPEEANWSPARRPGRQPRPVRAVGLINEDFEKPFIGSSTPGEINPATSTCALCRKRPSRESAPVAGSLLKSTPSAFATASPRDTKG